MKRIVTLLLAAGMLMGGATAAKAVDFNIKGMWQFGFEWGHMGSMESASNDTFNVAQRFRTQIDVIASESLRGVVYFDIGKDDWGRGALGVGGDGKDLRVRYNYIDWLVPNTELQVRMGLQPMRLPSFVAGETILGTDAAGITLSYQFNEMVGTTLFWTRLLDFGWQNGTGVSGLNDSIDAFGLTVPVTGDGFRVTPFGLIASVGRDAFNVQNDTVDQDLVSQGLLPFVSTSAGLRAAALAASDDDYSHPWWLGIGGEMTAFAPFRLAAEFRYGRADLGSAPAGVLTSGGAYADVNNITTFDLDRRGWIASLIAEYKLDFMTPGIIFWYSSGDDSNPYNGSERMPMLTASSNGTWTPTYLGFDGGSSTGTSRMFDGVAVVPQGTWGVVAQLKDMSFMQDLKHTLKLGYFRGTNDENMPENAGMSSFRSNADGLYLTEDDDAWEVNFVTQYQIYANLNFAFELAYLRVDFDESAWGFDQALWNDREEDSWKIGMYMQYNF